MKTNGLINQTNELRLNEISITFVPTVPLDHPSFDQRQNPPKKRTDTAAILAKLGILEVSDKPSQQKSKKPRAARAEALGEVGEPEATNPSEFNNPRQYIYDDGELLEVYLNPIPGVEIIDNDSKPGYPKQPASSKIRFIQAEEIAALTPRSIVDDGCISKPNPPRITVERTQESVTLAVRTGVKPEQGLGLAAQQHGLFKQHSSPADHSHIMKRDPDNAARREYPKI